MALIFTDGACKNNGKDDCMSSYGVLIQAEGELIREIVGIEEPSTSQRGEVLALLKAFQEGIKIHKATGEDIYIISDSEYGTRCIKNRWFNRWSRTGWLTAEDKPVKNQDLWQEFVDIIDNIPIDNLHVFQIKGHAIKLSLVADKKAFDNAYTMSDKERLMELYAYIMLQVESRFTKEKREKLLMKFAEKNSDVIPPMSVFMKLILGNLIVDILAQRFLDIAYKAKIKSMIVNGITSDEKFGWK